MFLLFLLSQQSKSANVNSISFTVVKFKVYRYHSISNDIEIQLLLVDQIHIISTVHTDNLNYVTWLPKNLHTYFKVLVPYRIDGVGYNFSFKRLCTN